MFWIYLKKWVQFTFKGSLTGALNLGGIIGAGILGVALKSFGLDMIFPEGLLGICVSGAVFTIIAWIVIIICRAMCGVFFVWRESRPKLSVERIFVEERKRFDADYWGTFVKVVIKNTKKIPVEDAELILTDVISVDEGLAHNNLNVPVSRDIYESGANLSKTIPPEGKNEYQVAAYLEPYDVGQPLNYYVKPPHINIFLFSAELEKRIYRLKLKALGRNSPPRDVYFTITITPTNNLAVIHEDPHIYRKIFR